MTAPQTPACLVCSKPTSAIWPGLCVADQMHTPSAALDAGKITHREFDEFLREIDRRVYHLEQNIRDLCLTELDQRVNRLEQTIRALGLDNVLDPMPPAELEPFPLSDAGEGC